MAVFNESFKYIKQQYIPAILRSRFLGAQWLSGRVLDSRPKGRGFEPHRRHCVVSLSKNINPSLLLVQPRKTRPFITERLLMGRKESNQTNKRSRLNSLKALIDKKKNNIRLCKVKDNDKELLQSEL